MDVSPSGQLMQVQSVLQYLLGTLIPMSCHPHHLRLSMFKKSVFSFHSLDNRAFCITHVLPMPPSFTAP